ncbi:MAG: SDR family NAD(P)-dependent oxidoreductase [Gammaproteobacteria bacterium]
MPQGKRVELYWITGASSGIGRALAIALARAGEDVAVSARSREALLDIAREAEALPGAIHPYPADVTDGAALQDVVKRIEADHGPIHHAILNAGIYDSQRSTHLSAEGYRRVFEVNVVGVAHCLEALLPSMSSRGTGEICLMGSLSAYRGLPESAPYGASKAALLNMAESLAPTLARKGIRLRLISPGFVRTPMTEQNRFPMPMIMDADKAVAIILRGLRGRKFEIAFPLRLAWMLKIARCLPYPLWFKFARRMLPRGKNRSG